MSIAQHLICILFEISSIFHMPTQKTSFHFPSDATETFVSIQHYSRLENGPGIVRVALIAHRELLEVTSAGYDVIIVGDHKKEWSYSPHAPFDYPGFKRARCLLHRSAPSMRPPGCIFLSAEVAVTAEYLRQQQRLTTMTDVIRRALTIYDELLRVVAAGDRIVLRDSKGKELQYSPHVPLDRVQLGLSCGPDAAIINNPTRPRSSLRELRSRRASLA